MPKQTGIAFVVIDHLIEPRCRIRPAVRSGGLSMYRSIQVLAALHISLLCLPALAADVLGRWRTIDDESGEAKSIVEIERAAEGVYSGRIVELFNPVRPDPACDKCSDDRKGQPIIGMEIIRNMRASGTDAYSGGTILKPDEGKVYRSKMKLIENGTLLEVSGCVLFICRSQTWERI